MARINIEDSIYKDKRFMQLIALTGNPDTALGMLVRAWSLAQKWYLSPNKMIPKKEWDEQELQAIVNVRLATVDGDFVMISGADKQFAWLRQRSDAGKLGGLKSLNNLTSDRKRPSAAVKPPYSLLSSHNNYNNKNVLPDGNTCVLDFELIYKEYPNRLGNKGKKDGLASLCKKIKSKKDFDRAMNATKVYNLICNKNKIIGTDKIAMFSTFFGTKDLWLDHADVDINEIKNNEMPKILKLEKSKL